MGKPPKNGTSQKGADVPDSWESSWHPEHGFLGNLVLHCLFHKQHSIFPQVDCEASCWNCPEQVKLRQGLMSYEARPQGIVVWGLAAERALECLESARNSFMKKGA